MATALLLGLVVALSVAGAAAAAPNTKPYTVDVSPASVQGGTTPTMTVLFTNQTTSQQLGSADLTSPLTVIAASVVDGPGTATLNGTVVALRDLAIPPGGTKTVSVQVDAPCSGGSYTWDVVAKQSNDFSGPPGNNMTLNRGGSTLTTQVTPCGQLRFFRQPQDAEVDASITSADFVPTAAPVAVEIVDPGGNRLSSSASITLSLPLTAPPGATLSGTRTVNAVNGLAEFPGLSIDTIGSYTLVATSTGMDAVSSDPFRIEQEGVLCLEGEPCSGGVSNSQLNVNASLPAGPAGVLTMSILGSEEIDCVGYEEIAGRATLINGPPGRPKTITYVIDRRAMNASVNNGAALLNMCYADPTPFTTKFGLVANVGLLPDCGAAPCIQSRRKDRAGNGIMVLLGREGDPTYRG